MKRNPFQSDRRWSARYKVIGVASGVIALLGITIGPALSGDITMPTGTEENPYLVPADTAGNPVPFTISGSDWTPGRNVFVQQCDGVDPATQGWHPSVNCDLGTSPAPAIADADGNVTFDAADPNHALHPFKGVSPQEQFNCLSAQGADPGNGLPSHRKCQIRMASNPSAPTADQAFIWIQLPPSCEDARNVGEGVVPGGIPGTANPTGNETGTVSRVVASGTQTPVGGVPPVDDTAGSISPELGQTVHDVNCDVVAKNGL